MNWLKRKIVNYVLDLIREYPEEAAELLTPRHEKLPKLKSQSAGKPKAWTPPYGYDRVVNQEPRDQNFK